MIIESRMTEFTAEINRYSFKSQSLKGRDIFEDGGINGRIILNWILRESVLWTGCK
jgi:hypothetical protein